MRRGLSSIGRWLLRLPRWIPAAASVAWMALIWRLSATEFGGGEPDLAWSWIANLAHAPLFGLLALLFVATLLGRGETDAWPRVDGRAGGLVLFLVGIYGVVDEGHQSLTPGRDSSLTDIATDLTGAMCVLWIIAYLGRGDAGEGGLRRRLAAGILACATVAFLGSLL